MSSSSSSGGGSRGKLSLKGESKGMQNLSFRRQTPKFLQQYQHLLNGDRKNYSNEVLVDEGRDFVRPGEKLTIEAIKASGVQIANAGENGEEEDEDFKKIRSLYERDDNKSLLSKPNAKPMSASDAFGIESEQEKAFNPNTEKITFKRKMKDMKDESSGSSSSVRANKGNDAGEDKDRKNEQECEVKEGDSNSSSSISGSSNTNDLLPKKKEKKRPVLISFDYHDD